MATQQQQSRVTELLGAIREGQREVVELRFFANCTLRETAELLGVSVGTVERDWRLARAKLYRRLKGPEQ